MKKGIQKSQRPPTLHSKEKHKSSTETENGRERGEKSRNWNPRPFQYYKAGKLEGEKSDLRQA